jgi:hypothetical protein
MVLGEDHFVTCPLNGNFVRERIMLKFRESIGHALADF